ncbi:MAG TPA: response regulator [Gemmatimonadales bacterium]|nr:response regulator [Gemmatimonadales bacterium]
MAHILVVDDEESILFAMEQYFTACGCTVDCARELEEAEALLTNIRYQLVLADLRLSGIHSAEGLDLVSMVRECCPNTRVIVITAFGTTEMEQEAVRRGADAFLHKSTPLPQLAQVARKLVGCAA